MLLTLAGCTDIQPTGAPAPTETPIPVTRQPAATETLLPTITPPPATEEAAPTATATPPLASPPPAGFDPATFSLQVELITEDLDWPVHVTHAGDGSGRLFVVEKPGTIQRAHDPDPGSDGRLSLLFTSH